MTWISRGPCRRVLVLLILGLSSEFVGVPHSSADLTELEPVEVYGESADSTGTEPELTGNVTHIDLALYRDRSLSVAELLDQVAGVRITRFGGLDDFVTVSIRGSSAEQVQVYWDGIPLNEDAGGAVNLAQLPAALIESITIYRGQAPARFDTSAIGGVVDIKSRTPQKKHRTQSTFSYGSLNTYRASALHQQGIGHEQMKFAYQFSRSAGDFLFTDDQGTPANSNDDIRTKRRNNEFARHHFIAQWTHRFNKETQIHLDQKFFREDRGIPGLGTLKSDRADLSTTRSLSQVSLDWHLNEAIQIKPQLFFSYLKSQFTDRAGEIGLGQQDNDDDSLHYGASTQVEWWPNALNHGTALLSYRGASFHPENFLQTGTPNSSSRRDRVSLTLEDEILIHEDRIVFSPLVRVEGIFNQFSGMDPSFAGSNSPNHSEQFPVSGKLGIRYQALRDLAFLTQGGRSYRVPSFIELFGDRGATVGNFSLHAESSWYYDLGVQWTPRAAQFRASFFEQQSQNLIQFLQTSQFTAQAQNLGDATVRGVELEGHASIGESKEKKSPSLDLDLTYTFQWPKDHSGLSGFDDKFLPGRPRHQLHLGGRFHYSWAQLFADWDFIASNFLDRFNAREVENRSLLSLGFSLNPWPWIEGGFEVKNLLNQQIADVVGFPVPGRLFVGQVSLKI